MQILTRSYLVVVLVGFLLPTTVFSQGGEQKVKQSQEVIQAYQVAQRFQDVFAEDLDFDRAFEATFTKDTSRRREIALAEGNYDGLDLASVDTDTLVSIYKSQMQMAYLFLPLLAAETKQEQAVFFPEVIREIFDRKPPKSTERFNAYADQLKQDAIELRKHLDRLAEKYPKVAEALRAFETWPKLKVPTNYVIKPLTAYSKGHVLGVKEEYYRVGSFYESNYFVIRENGEMRMIGIKLWNMGF
ncbi:MAG TPA: hypothetical protein VF074_08510 [Pyrinomonadaceae bacterium]